METLTIDLPLTHLKLMSLRPSSIGRRIAAGDGLRGKIRTGGDEKAQVSVEFTYRYRAKNKTHEVRCGVWPRDSLAEIRAARIAARAKLDSGDDPLIAKAEKVASVLEAKRVRTNILATDLARETVQKLFDAWHIAEASKRKDEGAEVRRAMEKDVLPKLGALYLNEVSRRHVMEVLDAVLARGANRLANVLLQYMRQMFTYAVLREKMSADPTYGLRKKHIGGRETERDRALSDAEIRLLAAQLPESGLTARSQNAVWVLLATMARVGELSLARRADVDLAQGIWRIPGGLRGIKSDRDHYVDLSPFAVRHLEAVIAASGESAWVMRGRGKEDSPIDPQSLQKLISGRQRLGKAIKGRTCKQQNALVLPGGRWTAHDLRRTGSTMMRNLRVPPDVIERCQNHAIASATIRTYQRADIVEERLEACLKLGARLETLKPSPPAGSELRCYSGSIPIGGDIRYSASALEGSLS